MKLRKRAQRVVAVVAISAALVLSVAVAAGATSGLKNVGGRTPMTKTITVAPQNVKGDKGPFAVTGSEKLVFTITGGASVTAPNCAEKVAPGNTCYVYRAFGVLTGEFTSVKNALVPNGGGKRITGRVSGTIKGVYQWDFYAEGYPYDDLGPGNVNSISPTIYKLFFTPGSFFGTHGLTSSKITYTACGQTWTVSFPGADTGNITHGC